MEWITAALRAKPGVTQDYKAEWQWERYQVGGKLFAALCQPGAAYGDYAGRRLLTLKCDPRRIALLRAEFPAVLPGFYMDKRNWISVDLDGGVPEDVVLDLCEQSYQLVFAKLTKKLQREILDASAVK